MTVPQRSILNRILDGIEDTHALLVGRWRWRKARTITDLATLRADRLAWQGDQVARSQANSTQDPDPRWATMYSALVALGHAGVVIDNFRPGTAAHGFEYDKDGFKYGVEMETRAAVSGFASTEVKDQIDNLLYHGGLRSFGDDAVINFTVMDLWGPDGDEDYKKFDGADCARWRGNPVERMDGTPTSWIGGSVNARELYRAFPTRRSVQRELRAAWLITIVDREWGGSTLFAELLDLLSKNGQDATV